MFLLILSLALASVSLATHNLFTISIEPFINDPTSWSTAFNPHSSGFGSTNLAIVHSKSPVLGNAPVQVFNRSQTAQTRAGDLNLSSITMLPQGPLKQGQQLVGGNHLVIEDWSVFMCHGELTDHHTEGQKRTTQCNDDPASVLKTQSVIWSERDDYLIAIVTRKDEYELNSCVLEDWQTREQTGVWWYRLRGIATGRVLSCSDYEPNLVQVKIRMHQIP